MMSAVPLTGSAVAADVKVIVEPLGASSGTFEQAALKRAHPNKTAKAGKRRKRRDIMKTVTILVPMKLAGQAQAGKSLDSERGYAMAVLLVALSIMAVMLTVVMPVWKHAGQREKEEELVFRGKQYVHAIGLFQRKFANTYPPTIDVLVEQRFLRKKFKDPITNDDFVPILAGQSLPGSAPGTAGGTGAQGAAGRGPTAQPGQPNQPGRAGQPGQVAQPGGRGTSPIGTPGGGTTGGISGVTSKSKDTSIRLYNGRSHYNEWAFVYLPQVQAPGAGGAPGTARPGQTGQPGQPGQPGFPPGGTPGQRGRGNPNGPGPNGPGGRGFGPGVNPVQPIFPPNPRGRF
jgi:type II secretory pathway pseudopilin PulG